MVLRMPSGVLSRYPFSGALGLGTFWAGPLASALRYSPLLALLLAPLFELLLVAGVPEAVDPSPAVVMSCGTQAASRVLRLMRVPPVSIERRFSMLGFMVGSLHIVVVHGLPLISIMRERALGICYCSYHYPQHQQTSNSPAGFVP